MAISTGLLRPHAGELLGFGENDRHKVRAMTKTEIIEKLLDPGIIGIIRSDSSTNLLPLAKALHAGGIKAIEVTMTTPNALQTITELSAHFREEALIGVGTVLDAETAREAIAAGAEFVITPVTKPEVIRLCARYGKPIASGAYTPGEALAAHEAGADFVKIFPADTLGPGYIRNILVPTSNAAHHSNGRCNGEKRESIHRSGMCRGGSRLDADFEKGAQEWRLEGTHRNRRYLCARHAPRPFMTTRRDLRAEILRLMQHAGYRPLDKVELSKALAWPADQRAELRNVLRALESEGLDRTDSQRSLRSAPGGRSRHRHHPGARNGNAHLAS